jgi:hypothetical protein
MVNLKVLLVVNILVKSAMTNCKMLQTICDTLQRRSTLNEVTILKYLEVFEKKIDSRKEYNGEVRTVEQKELVNNQVEKVAAMKRLDMINDYRCSLTFNEVLALHILSNQNFILPFTMCFYSIPQEKDPDDYLLVYQNKELVEFEHFLSTVVIKMNELQLMQLFIQLLKALETFSNHNIVKSNIFPKNIYYDSFHRKIIFTDFSKAESPLSKEPVENILLKYSSTNRILGKEYSLNDDLVSVVLIMITIILERTTIMVNNEKITRSYFETLNMRDHKEAIIEITEAAFAVFRYEGFKTDVENFIKPITNFLKSETGSKTVIDGILGLEYVKKEFENILLQTPNEKGIQFEPISTFYLEDERRRLNQENYKKASWYKSHVESQKLPKNPQEKKSIPPKEENESRKQSCKIKPSRLI